MGIIAARAQGAIMPNLNLSILSDIPLTLAPKTLQDMFDEMATNNDRLIKILHEQNARLTKARDLLLPRLMNGTIPV